MYSVAKSLPSVEMYIDETPHFRYDSRQTYLLKPPWSARLSPFLQIRLLGDLKLTCEGQPTPLVLKPRLQALLTYLLLHRDLFHTRRHVAFQFWPDSLEAQSLTNLRKLFFQLRQALSGQADILYSDPQLIGIRPNAKFSLDVDDLEKCLRQIRGSEEPELTSLTHIVELYRGDLLLSCYDEWISAPRSILRTQTIQALESQLPILEARHAFRKGAEIAEAILRIDPMNELANRHLMRFRLLQGNRAGAASAYIEFSKQLEHELGVQPDESTRLLADAIDYREPNVEPGAERFIKSTETTPPFAGRTQEWHQIHASLSRRSSLGPRMILVVGEPGIGKTRMLEEAIGWARTYPGTVAYSRCFASEVTQAYSPITSWLRTSYVRRTVGNLDALWKTELARLLPELLVEDPTLKEPLKLGDSWQVARFHEALAHALAPKSEPVLLVLDDVQWCDALTLGWLQFLFHFKANTPILAICAARSNEVDGHHPFNALRHAFMREKVYTEVALGPLSLAETTRLAQHWVPATEGSLFDAIYKESEGNPLFVVELMRAGFAKAFVRGDGFALPQTLQSVIEQRLLRFGLEERNLIEVGAVMGREFTIDEVQACLRIDLHLIAPSLEMLLNEGVLRNREGQIGFSHDKIREVVLSQATLPRLRVLHGSIFDGLLTTVARSEDKAASELALHAEHAGRIEEAVVWLMRAAQISQNMAAYNDATILLRRALSLLPAMGIGQSQAQRYEIELLTLLGACSLTLRGYGDPEVELVYQRAYSLSTHVESSHDVMPILVGLGLFYMIKGDLNRALEIAQQSLVVAEKMGDDGMLVEAHLLLGPILQYQGKFVLSLFHLQQGVALYRQDRDGPHAHIYGQEPGVVGHSLLASAQWQLGYPESACVTMELALSLAKTSSHIYSLILAHSFAAHLYHMRREPDQVLLFAQEGLSLASKHGFIYWQLILTMFQCWALAVTRRDHESTALQCSPDENLSMMQGAFAAFMQSGAGHFRSYYMSLIAEVQATYGQYDRAVETINQALQIDDDGQDRFWHSELLRLKAIFLMESSRLVDDKEIDPIVMSTLYNALEVANSQSAQTLQLRVCLDISRLLMRSGSIESAIELLTGSLAAFPEQAAVQEVIEVEAVLADLRALSSDS